MRNPVFPYERIIKNAQVEIYDKLGDIWIHIVPPGGGHAITISLDLPFVNNFTRGYVVENSFVTRCQQILQRQQAPIPELWRLFGFPPGHCPNCGSTNRYQDQQALDEKGYSFLVCRACGYAEFDD